MAQPFRNQCAALRIKPNSNILQYEDELRTAEVVDLTNNYIGGSGVQALSDILKNNTCLNTLILHSNGLSNESVVFLCRALRQHPSLKFLDLSGNPLSLPAGLALLQYVHSTTTIEEIKLDGTLIDELLIRKVQRCININRGSRTSKPAPAVQATLAHINAEFDDKKAVRERAKQIRLEVAEQLSNSTMRELANNATLPPRDPESGWMLINIYASTTPGDFFSELDTLENQVIPTLNKTFFSRKVHFVLSSIYHGLNTKQRASLPRTCFADVQAALNKAPTIFLQFLGDKVGEFADLGESTPLQHYERENTPASQRGMCLYLIRQCSKLLKLPAALVPLYSDDPQLVNPDTTTSLVKNALLEARGIQPPAAYDAKLAASRWATLEAQKKSIIDTSSKYASMPYTACFDCVDKEGNIHLKNLDALSAGIIRRITAFFDILLSLKSHNNNNNNETPSLKTILRSLNARSAILPGRKSLTGKLDLYCVTPPSRNSLLLAHEAGAGATTLLQALNSRLEKRPGFIIASHFAREPLLASTGRSRDAKTMFLQLTQNLLDAYAEMQRESFLKEQEKEAKRQQQQLGDDTVNSASASSAITGSNTMTMTSRNINNNNSATANMIPTTIKSTVADDLDVHSAKELFVQTLTDVAAEALPKSTVIVILVDGIDNIDFPENPCDALRRHEATGADDWPSTDPAAAQSVLNKKISAAMSSAESTSQKGGGATSSTADGDDNNNNNNNNNQDATTTGTAASATNLQQQTTPVSYDELDWIPTCLAKNVRFVLTCQQQSRAHQQLEVRGHDSCDVVAVPELGDADFEAIMTKLCEIHDVDNTVTEMDLATIRTKSHFRSPQYLQFVLESLISAQLSPQYLKRSTALSSLPDTIDRACDALLDQFESEFGLPFATLVCTSLASCAKSGGILDVHLRELIQRMRIARGDASTEALADARKDPLINVGEFERMLRILRPVVDSSSALLSSMCNSGTNLGPLSGSFHVVNIRCSNFTDCVRRRYLSTLDAAASAHKHLAHFYLRHCDHNDPFQVQSIRAATYHVVEAGLWDTLEERILTLPFLSNVMRTKQVAPFFSVLVRAYNLLQPVIASAHLSSGGDGTATTNKSGFKPAPPSASSAVSNQSTTSKKRPVVGKSKNNHNKDQRSAADPFDGAVSTAAAVVSLLKPTHQHVALLQLLREYIYFIRRHFRTLTVTPHLVAQLAVLLPVDNTMHVAANKLLSERKVPRLVPVLGRTRNVNLHHGLISGCQFTPSGLRIATGSHDGTVKVSNVMGETVHTIRDAAAKVLFIKYSQTSRYLVAACENHVILVIDAASGSIVSQIKGHAGTIKCLNMTARGRNVLAGYEDRDLWVWDSETARHVSTVSHQSSSSSDLSSSSSNSVASSSQFAGVNGIIPHPTDERIVYTICDRRLVGSRILHSTSAMMSQEGATSASAENKANNNNNDNNNASNVPQFETLLNITGHSSLPLAAESCYVVCDGTFAVLCARDLVQQPPSFVRSEANIKVFSLQTGRMIAAFGMESSATTNAPSAVSCIVSPDERWLVSGSLDGKMRIYQPDWRTYSTIDDSGLPEPTSVRPSRVLNGFNDVPPRLMRFSFDSKTFLAAANGVARIWPTGTATKLSLPNSEEVINAQDDGMMLGFDTEARIELTIPNAVITCCDWSPNPSDDGAEIVIGDDKGKLYCLREQQ